MLGSIMTNLTPGLVALFGSGETSPSGRKIFDFVLSRLPAQPHIVMLETPAGFELNSSQVIGKVGDFICHRLQNYQPRLSIVPARMRGTPFSPDNPEILQPLLEADLIFMGPGSPTYAIRQLQDSLAWHYLVARHFMGASLVLASAATIAISAYALPVYEIYKVGEDLHWKQGLDFFGLYGLPIIFVPHWNNNDGGADLDTSRCFMGRSRFSQLLEMIPKDSIVIGIDERTALIIDMQERICHVMGAGGVTMVLSGKFHVHSRLVNLSDKDKVERGERLLSRTYYFKSGESFPLDEYIPVDTPFKNFAIRSEFFEQVEKVQGHIEANRQAAQNQKQIEFLQEIPVEIQELVAERQSARERKDWKSADILRQKIASLGWQLVDTPEGTKVVKE